MRQRDVTIIILHNIYAFEISQHKITFNSLFTNFKSNKQKQETPEINLTKKIIKSKAKKNKINLPKKKGFEMM